MSHSSISFAVKCNGSTVNLTYPSTLLYSEFVSSLEEYFQYEKIKIVGLNKPTHQNQLLSELTNIKLDKENKIMILGTEAKVLKELTSKDKDYADRELAEKLQFQENLRIMQEKQRMEEKEKLERDRIAAEQRRMYELEAAERRRIQEIEWKQRETERIQREIAAEQELDAKIHLEYQVLVSPEYK